MNDELKALAPRVRFPEFKGAPGWARTKLSSVLTDHGLTSDGKSVVHSASLASGIVPQIEHMGRNFAATDTTDYGLVRPFDIVYTRSPLAIFKLGIVKQHKRPGNAIVSPLYGVFTPKNKHLGLLVEAYFESPSRSIHYLDPLAQKGAKNTIQLSNDRFLSGSLFLPHDEEEQRKTAECLTSLEEWITAERRKLEVLRAHKKGLMQRLFPREGAPGPRVRFQEFQGAPEWRLAAAREYIDVLQGYGFPDRLQGRKDGEFPFYKVSDISAIVDAGGVYLSEAKHHVEREVVAELRAKPLPVGATVFAKIGEAIRSNKRAMTTRPSLIDNNVAGVKAIEGMAHDEFVYHLWSMVTLIEHAPGVVPAVNKSAIEQMPVRFPEPDEQQRIAACLSLLDAVIGAQSRKVDGLQKHKRGLIQQFFPMPGGSEL